MPKRITIETVNTTFRDILNTSLRLGGKIIMFGGDFRQVLPVVPKATRQQAVNENLARSYLWHSMETLQLKRNMRAEGDSEFVEFLLRIGNGTEPTTGDEIVALLKELIVASDK